MRDTRSVSETNSVEFERIRDKVQYYFERKQYIPLNTRPSSVHELSRIARDEYKKVNESIVFLTKMVDSLSVGFPADQFSYQFPFLKKDIDNLNDLLSKAKEAYKVSESFRTSHTFTYENDDVACREYIELRNTLTGHKNKAWHLMRGLIQHFNDYKATLERVTADINKLYIMLVFGEEELDQLSFSI